MFTIEYSSMCLNDDNYIQKIKEADKLITSEGYNFGVQLHNSISKNFYNKILKFKDKINLSIHSPVFTKYLLNLAKNNFEDTKNNCDENIKYLKQINSDVFFFHGFFMTDMKIPNDICNYRKIMYDNIPSKYQLNRSFTMNPDFFNTDEFTMYKENYRKNFKKVKELYPDYTISVENDYVGIGSGMQRREEIFELTDNLWLDTGHLWCTSLVHGYDFYETIDELIEKKNITGVHINHSLMTQDTPFEEFKDSHTHLYIKNDQNLKPVVKKLINAKVPIITLEIIDGDIEDVKILLNWINS